ncbi:MAG TPA: cytidylate kinase-like family protein [Candidatus Aquilonibacter sp.]|nr:cytidylate kinase-like family protein [Candidatus Aquilonibacter sp.]
MIVTISNQYGSGAVAIAARAAAALDYTLVDRQLPIVVAKRLGISRETAREAEDTGRSLGARLLSSLEMATPEVAPVNFAQSFDETMLREVQRAVRDYAARGNAVIVGRAAGIILGRRDDVIRIYMHAPREWRIERIVTEFGLQPKDAAAEIDRVDRARRAYLRDWYRVDFGSPEVADLAIDTSSFGEEASASLIVAAVHARR